ncbi:MAG: nucleotidyltransferase family protein [Lachnospiraceae bacterium]|nr:nucleotidyltransferase family protein [Lachnospiraceae bacterium]
MNTTKRFISTGNPVYDTMFALLRTALWGEQRFPMLQFSPDAIDWAALYKELRYQTVQNLPLDLLCHADPQHKTAYMQSAVPNLKHYYQILKEQQTVYQLLQSARIPCVILKGTSAARYYPTPSYRCMGDVDLIVRPDDFQRTFDLLCENGYEYDGVEDLRHIHLKHHGVLFELHRYFALLNNREQAAMLDNRIFEGLAHAQVITLDGYSFPSLPVVENGLVFLDHICQHIEGGIGLRQIIDWMMYADRELNDEFWTTGFQPIVQALGLETLAVTVTRMCQLYLGLREDITWCSHADESLCEELITLLMESGNWGRKRGKHVQKSIDTLIVAKNAFAFFRYLQQRGISNWALLQRYPWLKPFAWLYQLCRYIRKGFSGEHPIRSFLCNLKKIKKTDSLLDRLEISRRSKGQ